MSWLRTMIAEFVGLFVDDGIFAIAIVLWIGLTWLLPTYLPLPEPWTSLIFFAGLAFILFESAVRRAHKDKSTKI